MKIFLDSIGCRLNQSEIEKMAFQFRMAGHEIVSTSENADLVVINTCAVTAAASSDSRQHIRQVAKKSKGQTIVTGCWATMEPDVAIRMPTVQSVVENDKKDELVSIVLKNPPDESNHLMIRREPLPGLHRRTRAFIKVQDGCNNYCTYCITRIARGKSRSMPVSEILADITRAELGGTKEVVLSGAQLGSWGRDLNPVQHLSDLLLNIFEASKIPRVRLSSLEPWEVDEHLLDLITHARFCHHLHLPLQSGSTNILQRMGRRINPSQYSETIQEIRNRIPDIAITTDIMVGFPGESEEEFQQSLEFVKAQQFSGGHVFSFSSRVGTPAANYSDHISPDVKKNRSKIMQALINESAQDYRNNFIGHVVQVLWEKTIVSSQGDWLMEGLSDNYLRVVAKANEDLWNEFSMVELRSYEKKSVMEE